MSLAAASVSAGLQAAGFSAPAVGEWVITNGVGGGYPRGLVVAQVAAVNHNDAATVDEAVLAWVNDTTSLSVVLVITDFTPS